MESMFRSLAILVVVVLAIGAVGAVAYYGWLEYSGELEVRRLVAQAAALTAQAEADEAAAELANANAVLAPAEAAALTVERQSAVMTFYGVITPLGLVAVAFTIVILGFGSGASVVLLAQKKQGQGKDD